MLKTIPSQEAGTVEVAVLVCPLLADVQPRGHDVLWPDIWLSIRAVVLLVPARHNLRKALPAEVPVVAGRHESDESGTAGVDIDHLLMTPKREGRNGIELLALKVQNMHGQADETCCAVYVGDPLFVRDEQFVLHTQARTPLVLDCQVRRTKGLHEPIRLCRSLHHNVLPFQIDIAMVRRRASRAGSATLTDLLAFQVVDRLDGLARIHDHGIRIDRRTVLHELG
mmetsp:Transcript_80385/g.204432  ORF Transcript_80385/g.204432 Transcript_80385/m.204432 type:complete len:225 (+) Transcript_80385:328-1002(+)